jgi:dTMP kinase
VLAVIGSIITHRALTPALADEEAGRLDLPIESRRPGAPRQAGLFVVFEGGDGSGKSTQIRLLRSAVERAGHDGPGHARAGRHGARRADPDGAAGTESAAMSDRTEALLYAAARAQHVDEVIRPALEAGTVVLSDRYLDSSVVYQGSGRGLGEVQIAELNRWGHAGWCPT